MLQYQIDFKKAKEDCKVSNENLIREKGGECDRIKAKLLAIVYIYIYNKNIKINFSLLFLSPFSLLSFSLLLIYLRFYFINYIIFK